jgi:hypothetical protein
MRTSLLTALLLSLPALADTDTFYGWSKDGTYFVYQSVSGPNDLTELFFCLTDDNVSPSWPKDLNEMERMGSPFGCARFTDVNRAPYGWNSALVLPKPSTQGPTGARVLTELVSDGERPGYAFESGGKRSVCYASGLHEDSKLGQVYWHPNGRFLAAFVDGRFIHCDVALKAGPLGKPAPAAKPPKKKTK